MRATCHANRGFTLIEMITVFAILSVLAAVAIPGIGNWIGKTSLRSSVDKTAQLLSYMKGEALGRGTTVKGEIDDDEETITTYFSEEAVDCQDSEVTWVALNNDLAMEKIDLSSTAENSNLCFYRDGTSNGGTLTLNSKHGEYEVRVLSATAFIEKQKIE